MNIYHQQIQRNTNKSIAEILIFLGLGFGSFIAILEPAYASEITPQKIVELVNESRLGHGTGIVTLDGMLSDAAYRKAQDMFDKQYFDHNTPDGKEPWYWVESSGYEYKYAGENLAINFIDAEKQHIAWMESPTHRKNILNPEYQDIGIAVLSGEWQGKQTMIVVQFFGKTMSAVALEENGALQPRNKTLQEIAKGMSVDSQAEWAQEGLETNMAPVFSLSGDVYDRAILIVSLLFAMIICADILILNYIQVRNIYPIAKDLLRYMERQEG